MYVSWQFTKEQITIYSNVAYSTRPNYKGIQCTSETTREIEEKKAALTMCMDIYVPPDATDTTRQPLVIYLHGGSFTGGSKEDVGDEATRYALAGYVAATINYRLTSGAATDADLHTLAINHASEDAMNAVRFLKKNAIVYHIDTSRIVTVGVSAGGGISLMTGIGADEFSNMASDYPGYSAKMQAAVSTGAALAHGALVNSSLLKYDATDARILIFHAKDTDRVTLDTWKGNVLPSQNLVNKSGNECVVVPQPNLSHTEDLSPGISGYWRYTVDFLWKELRLGSL